MINVLNERIKEAWTPEHTWLYFMIKKHFVHSTSASFSTLRRELSSSVLAGVPRQDGESESNILHSSIYIII